MTAPVPKPRHAAYMRSWRARRHHKNAARIRDIPRSCHGCDWHYWHGQYRHQATSPDCPWHTA